MIRQISKNQEIKKKKSINQNESHKKAKKYTCKTAFELFVNMLNVIFVDNLGFYLRRIDRNVEA